MRWRVRVALCCLLWVCVAPSAFASPSPSTSVHLGESTVALNGPWRFHLGDDPRWAAPDFDDSAWEVVDLTPKPGAHDGDVGLPGYVPGWSQRGHAGYSGYAWYRQKVTVEAGPDTALALAGPTHVDSTYNLYVDGELRGGPGVFTGIAPIAHSVRPTVFPLPGASALGTRTYLIAFRVWMDVGDAGDDGGGIHIAPTIGSAAGIDALHQVQWLRTFNGYVVDLAEPIAFLLLAVMTLALMACRTRDAYHWLVIALVILALLRVNQVLYAWTDLQSLRGYDIAVNVVLKPLALAAWTLAWRDWFDLHHPRLTVIVALLAAVYLGLALVGRPWFMPGTVDDFRALANSGTGIVRLAFVVLYLWVVGQGLLSRATPWALLSALAATLVGVGLFATELNKLGIPGIWFPYGVGVARGQYAYAAFVVVLFGLILGRLVRAARIRSVAHSRGAGLSR